MIRELKIDHLFEVKTNSSDAEINFSISNMQFLLTPEELPFTRDSIRLHNFPGDSRLGSRHLLETLSRRESVPPENIFLAVGSSMANFVIWSALLERGDEVLVEFPTYEPMYRVPRYLGGHVRFLKRDPSDFSLSPEAIEKKVSEKTRMIILTDSHNPSGNQISTETLQYLRDLAHQRKIWVLIDEIYAKYYRDHSLFFDFPEFIVTSSLTKYYGLGSMRVGWAFAPVEVVERARNFLDFISPELPFATMYLAHLLLNDPVFEVLESRIRERVKTNRELVIEFLNRNDLLTCYLPKNGILFFPEVRRKVDMTNFYSVLREKFAMAVTAGAFFQMPRHFRVAAVWDPGIMEEGLNRIESALKETAITRRAP
jgi:hypothetical protein